MEFFELMDISHRYLEILNPSSREKILTVGEVLALDTDSRVIDFGCGKGELLALWAEKFGTSGTGVDISEQFCEKARIKIQERKLDDRIDIVCANGSEYTSDDNKYDAGLCIGGTFIWGDFRKTIQALRQFVRPGGKLVIGEVYVSNDMPREYIDTHSPETTRYEYELLQTAREEGYTVEYAVRASHDDWDRYEAGNWRGLVNWLNENPTHPERPEVIDRLRGNQDEYFRYGREYLGWAIYVLSPMTY
ncbi:MAG: class I SAM-dependent methyltransferase [Dehalococcoidales bacterium]|nr:MAG: class I SAM-dependent methyltransferase [Dehalococcoidales bacterium]